MVTKNQDSNVDNLTIGQPTTNTTNRGDLSIEGNLNCQGSVTAASQSLTTDATTGGNPSPSPQLGLYKAITLSAAQIIALNATPLTLIPAPGAGKAIIVTAMMLRMTRTSTQFTSGGDLVAQYHTGAVAATSTIAASVVTGAAGVADYAPTNVAVAPVENDAIELTNATAAFATGTGTGVLHIWYSIV